MAMPADDWVVQEETVMISAPTILLGIDHRGGSHQSRRGGSRSHPGPRGIADTGPAYR
ncbi:hypothetical protein FOZ63_031222 [Perkinsus olseni]|uniref:Uncharacterized protein n=1 Tax=Perkinsus olseni TaxID=32597 RepID=A0A7J6Q7Y4_PEROL|nr:hypothetical protein FOZ63_031222 [Perkinsus olseni]